MIEPWYNGIIVKKLTCQQSAAFIRLLILASLYQSELALKARGGSNADLYPC